MIATRTKTAGRQAAAPRNARWKPAFRAALLHALAAVFLLQTLSWAARLPAPQAADATEICTEHGVAVILLDVDGNPVEPAKAPPSPHDCPLCPLIAGLSTAPPWIGAPPPPDLLVEIGRNSQAPAALFAGPASDVWARGPPAA